MADLPDWQTAMNISGQSVTVNENITGQTVAVYSGSQYAPVQGNGKYINGIATGILSGGVAAAVSSYAVPVGHTLFIQGVAWGVNYMSVPGAFYMSMALLKDNTTGLIAPGAVAGGCVIFDSPVPIASGHTASIDLWLWFAGGGTINVWGGFWGWQQ